MLQKKIKRFNYTKLREFTMELNLKKWEAYMQQDPALQDRLQRINPQGYPATRKGDLLCLKAGKRSIVVSWNGKQLSVESREPKKVFLSWNLGEKKFNELFLIRHNPSGPCGYEQ